MGTLVLLAGLPLLVRRYVGPVCPGWGPRLVRVGGYAVVLALIAATAVQQRIGSQLGGYFPVILPIWAMDVGFLLIITGYVAGLLGKHRRDWVHALLAETDELPALSARLAWLGGGLWLVAREVFMKRIIQALAFAALRHEYYFEESVNGAGDGTIALLIVPLIGAALGALRGHLRYPPAATRPEGLPEGV